MIARSFASKGDLTTLASIGYKTLLEQFTNNELIDKATLDKQYEKELREGTGVGAERRENAQAFCL